MPKLLKVFLSSSKCIYENLTLEEWIFRNHNFAKEDILLIWRNEPAVVIGRYQNPWIEANVCYCQEKGISLARRYSGGGTVYHDLGNMNVSILTTHERHLRKRNLQNLATQLNADLPFLPSCRVIANSRDDLVIENGSSKISGTAARISHGKAYHHFTLLVHAELQKMRYALHSPLKDKIETTATRSVRAASVACIAQKTASNQQSVDELMEIVKNSVVKAFSMEYEGIELEVWNGSKATDFAELKAHLMSIDWIYGKTPKFNLRLLDNYTDEFKNVLVENGIIKESDNREFPVGQYFHRAFLFSKYSELFVS